MIVYKKVVIILNVFSMIFVILQEIIYLISTNLAINIRRLNIRSEAGVFTCEMDVLVEDVNAVTKMCKRLSKVKGVNKAIRQS